MTWMYFNNMDKIWHGMDENNMRDEINIDNFNGCVDQIQPYWDDGQTNL
jgi:hypothetical protein